VVVEAEGLTHLSTGKFTGYRDGDVWEAFVTTTQGVCRSNSGCLWARKDSLSLYEWGHILHSGGTPNTGQLLLVPVYRLCQSIFLIAARSSSSLLVNIARFPTPEGYHRVTFF